MTSLVWNNDGTMLASGSDDMTVKIWSVGDSTGNLDCLLTLDGHSKDNEECTCGHIRGDGTEYCIEDKECPVTGHSSK